MGRPRKQRVMEYAKVPVTAVAIVEHDIVESNGKIAVQITAEEIEKCKCIQYEGEDFHCKIHTAKAECPKCKCIDTNLDVPGALTPMANYRCRVCGIFYMRNMIDGKYLYSP